jgi:hypothetical protein
MEKSKSRRRLERLSRQAMRTEKAALFINAERRPLDFRQATACRHLIIAPLRRRIVLCVRRAISGS